MKNSLFSTLWLILFPMLLFSQSKYNDFAAGDREKIFYDDFSTNQYGWTVGTFENCRQYAWYTGYLEVSSLCKGVFSMSNFNMNNGFTIQEDRDFEIETSMIWISGEEGGGNTLCWGKEKNTDSKFSFGFSGNGQYFIGKSINGSYSHIKSWEPSSLINVKSYNKLTVRKVDDTYYFFINEGLVFTCPFIPFFGQVHAFQSYQNSIVRIDYVRISYLKKQPAGQPMVQPAIQPVVNPSTGSFVTGLPPILAIQDIEFSTNLLNSGETAQLSVTLKNIGPGDANGVYVRVTGDLTGLQFNSLTNFPVIEKGGGTQTVTIDVKGGLDLPTAEAVLKLEVVEPNFKVKIQGKQVKFPTKEFLKPELILAKFAVVENLSANPNNQIDINEQIDVKFAVQNVGEGNAENVTVTVTNNQPGVMLLGVVDNSGNLVRRNPSFNSIITGKYETITYRYFVNSEFTSNELTFSITSKEKNGKYGFIQNKSVEINKVLQEEGYIRAVATKNSPAKGAVVIEDIPDFIADVDQNIPKNAITGDKTFAVVIGNETYTKEIKVKYALNDARIFKKYLQTTFGLPASNITCLENATFGQILDALNWIKEVIKAYKGQAKVVFYYAGHGMPDEKTKSAFLLPVDGNSQNPQTAVKLAEIYDALAEYPSSSVTVYLDACFSGSARETGDIMLAQGRGVKIRPKEDLIKGNSVVFSAATGDETALPYIEKQHGMFTYYLLKKLQESRGEATLGDLSTFITTNVTRQSVVMNKKSQTPQVNTSLQMQNAWQAIKLK